MKVILHASFWSKTREGQYSLKKEIDLPFAPFPGLRIWLADLKGRLQKAKKIGSDWDVAGFYEVDTVAWDQDRGCFEVESPAFDRNTRADEFRAECDTMEEVRQTVRFFIDVEDFFIARSTDPNCPVEEPGAKT